MLKRLLPLLLIISLTLLFFHQMAFTDKILARGDTYNYFYPYWDVRNEAYRAGELPMWTPDLFMGAPLLAKSTTRHLLPSQLVDCSLPRSDSY